MGFMEEWGSGLRRIAQKCVEFGLQKPVLVENEVSTVMTFTRNVVVKENVPQDVLQGQKNVPQDDSQFEKSIDSIILRLINENNKVSREEIARVAGVNVKTIARHLKTLSSKVKYVGSGYSGHWEIIER